MQYKISVFTFLISFITLAWSAQPSVQYETYQFDPNHTYVTWHANHFGFSNPSGKWLAHGTLQVDEKHPELSQVNIIIKIDTLETGIPKFNEHLKSADFFDTAKYPVATFTSDKIIITGKDTAKVMGKLSLHGVVKPITLNVKLNKQGISPVSNKPTAGFSGTATLNRSDFGMKSFLPGVGDKVTLDFEAEASKEGSKI